MSTITETPQNPQDVKITLHWLEASRSQRIVWLLEELKVSYEVKLYHRTSDRLADPKLKEIHPLGKSPVITVEAPALNEPLVLAESGAIVEFLCEHFGQWLIPKHYQDGKEGQVGGETESWLRNRFFLHYAEGTLMTFMVLSIVLSGIRAAPVPFFVKPITKAIANRVASLFVDPNLKTNYDFLEGQLASSPDGGQFLCGKDLTAADILMIFPLEGGQIRSGLSKESHPKIWAYVERLHQRDAYKRSVEKIKSIDEKFQINL